MTVGRFSRAELDRHRDQVVPDLLGPDPKLLFVGINPSLWTAAAGAHFARPGNRFWPALHAAGLTARLVDASGGMDPDDEREVLDRGIGISNLVARATARADELSAEELVEGGRRLVRLVERTGPVVVAVLGVTAFRAAFGRRSTRSGPQDEPFGAAGLWVLPNPSGLNAHETVASLAEWYGRAADAAGIVPARPGR